MKHIYSLPSRSRQAFTLIELLIVITILTIILSMTIATVNFATESQRISGGASQVQSFLAGARDRAIYEKEPRGVRFFVDPFNTRAVTAMAYIQPGQKWSVGNVDLRRFDLDNDGEADSPQIRIVAGDNLGWWQLKRRGLITNGSLIEIPRDSGRFYEIDTSLIDITAIPGYANTPPTPEFLILRIPYSEPGGTDKTALVAHQSLTYQIQLPSQLVPQEPSLLPEDVVIDLDGSRIPIGWRPSLFDSEGQFSPYMDIFFSPRGNVIGAASSAGILHFYVCDANDSVFLKDQYLANSGVVSNLQEFESAVSGRGSFSAAGPFPFVPANEIGSTWADPAGIDLPYIPKDRSIISVFAQTGAIVQNEVSADVSSGGLATAPYARSETGVGVK